MIERRVICAEKRPRDPQRRSVRSRIPRDRVTRRGVFAIAHHIRPHGRTSDHVPHGMQKTAAQRSVEVPVRARPREARTSVAACLHEVTRSLRYRDRDLCVSWTSRGSAPSRRAPATSPARAMGLRFPAHASQSLRYRDVRSRVERQFAWAHSGRVRRSGSPPTKTHDGVRALSHAPRWLLEGASEWPNTSR